MLLIFLLNTNRLINWIIVIYEYGAGIINTLRDYVYDFNSGNGNLKSRTFKNKQTQTAVTETFAYDSLYRLTIVTGGSAAMTINYGAGADNGKGKTSVPFVAIIFLNDTKKFIIVEKLYKLCKYIFVLIHKRLFFISNLSIQIVSQKISL